MSPEREIIRRKYEDGLESCTRFGAWSLDKYKENEGYVVFHWVCGRWNHTFYNDSKNYCQCCVFGDRTLEYPEELEAVYRIANFDLMTDRTYNANV